jgi:hypothetical protein
MLLSRRRYDEAILSPAGIGFRTRQVNAYLDGALPQEIGILEVDRVSDEGEGDE